MKNIKNVPLGEITPGKLPTVFYLENLIQGCPKGLYTGAFLSNSESKTNKGGNTKINVPVGKKPTGK
jgi:hypothetical protein